MRMLVLAATEMELQQCRDYCHQIGKEGLTRFRTVGVGAIAAAFHTYQYILECRPDIVLLVGIAGSFDKKITLGTTFLVRAEIQATTGVEENGAWKDVFDMGLVQKDQPPYQDGWLVNPFLENYMGSGLPVANSISVDEITTSMERRQAYADKYQPVLESMEGAAFHFVCLQIGIPFLQIRSVSNYVGDRDKAKWDFSKALANLNDGVMGLMKHLG